MAIHSVTQPDYAWLSLIASRRAVLWLGRSVCGLPEAARPALAAAFAHSWLSVYVDGADCGFDPEQAVDANLLEPLTLRKVAQDPDAVTLAPNRIPVYMVPAVGTGSAKATLTRLKMFQRVPAGSTVFAVMTDLQTDGAALAEALEVSGEVAEVVIVGPGVSSVALQCRRVVHWPVDVAAFRDFVGALAVPKDAFRQSATVAIATEHGIRPVDLSGAIDPSSPLLERFELIPSDQVLAEVQPTASLVEQLLIGPTSSWKPYAAGIPFDRTHAYRNPLRGLLKDFAKCGPEATCTAWLEAEQASGATTLLRTLAYGLAQEGYPVLLARPGTVGFDFQQLSAFLRANAPLIDQAGGHRGEIPWTIFFDAEHSAHDGEFVAGAANGLRKLGHLCIVLAVRPVLPSMPCSPLTTHGPVVTLGQRLLNVITRDEARALGEHLNRFLPPHQRRRVEDWVDFLQQSERLTGEGRQSLFWLALRFWLLRFPGSEQPLRQWLASKFEAMTADSDEVLCGMAEVALLSAYRIAMPGQLLTKDVRSAIRPLADDPSQPFGLRSFWSAHHEAYAVAHPLVADETLRICAAEPQLLKRLAIPQCTGPFDLQLSLFERVLARDATGEPRVLPVVEEIVTTALRVDPRESPRNYLSRERIVFLLERAPDSVFDGSQLFLHHLAKARRHLAVDPPAGDFWADPKNVREQLVLAESHLVAALAPNFPVPEDRSETPLNLHVTMALTCDVRSRFELSQGDAPAASRYRALSQEHYVKAQALDPDNTYVLENFARFKLHEARDASAPEQRVALAIEAVTLLEWEMAVDGESRRREAILETLVSAYDLLQYQVGLDGLRAMADRGDEAASIAVARYLAFPDRFSKTVERTANATEALVLLRRIPADRVTWRSRQLVYQLVSKSSPRGFDARLAAADELNAMSGFPWPLQTRLEYAILLFQMGRHRDGQRLFAEIRELLVARSAVLTMPAELRYLADPKASFAVPLRTSILVTNTSSVGRNFYGIPRGWGSVEIPFRPYLFARKRIAVRDDLDCLIQFTQFGPQAVPPTEA